MSSGDVVRCKVCNAACEQRGYNIQRTCRSCQEFYQRSVQKMNRYAIYSYCKYSKLLNANEKSSRLWRKFINILLTFYFCYISSSSFSYTCNCAQNCEARNSVMCNIGSDGKRNHCKYCRYVKYSSTWRDGSLDQTLE